MEENNNNGNKVLEKGKKLAKDATKQAIKRPLKHILMLALPYIAGFFIILLIIGVLNAVVYMVQSWFTSIFNPTAADSTDGDSQMQSVIYINEDGEYKVNEDFTDKILEQLEAKAVDTEDLELITEDFDDLIEKYVEAEFQTMLPYTGNFGGLTGNDIEGKVLIARQLADRDEREIDYLDYIPYDEFMDKIAEQDDDVLDNFSIKPDNFHLMIAERPATSQKSTAFDGSTIEDSSSKITIAGDEEQGIDYLPLIQNYGAPFNLFLSLHMIVLDAEFMDDFVEMVLDNDDEIILTYVEKQSKSTTVNEYSGNYSEIIQTSTYTKEMEHSEFEKLSVEKETVNSEEVNSLNIVSMADKFPKINLKDYWKLETTHSSGSIHVMSADSWLKRTKKAFKYIGTDPTSNDGNPTDPITLTSLMTKDGEEQLNPTTRVETWSYSIIENYVETTTTTTESSGWTTIDEENYLKVQEIIDFINKYPGVVDNLKSAPSQLFYSLEQDESTQKLAQVMRYIIFRLTGVDYGVTSEEDLEELLSDKQYTQYNGVGNLSEYLLQFSHGSAGAEKSEDGKYYKMYGDGNGWPTIGDADLQWKSQYSNFSKAGKIMHNGEEKEVPNVAEYINTNCMTKGATAEYTNAEVAAMNIYIDVELVDEIGTEKQIADYNTILEYDLSGLTLERQQVYPLVAIKYNFGHLPKSWDGRTFKEVYLDGINKERFEEKSWKHNQYVWDNWWCQLGGGYPGHITSRDAQFETYVKGVFDFSTSDAGTPFGRRYYLYYTQKQLVALEPYMEDGQRVPYKTIKRTAENAEETFTMEVMSGVFIEANEKYIVGYYTSTMGRKFTILDQTVIDGWGQRCNRAACAIIASGYSNEDANELIAKMNANYDEEISSDTYWNLYGLTRTEYKWEHVEAGDFVEIIRKQLNKGGYVAVWVDTKDGDDGEVYSGKSLEEWTDYMHWMAILDYKVVDGQEKIVIADWRGAADYDIDEFIHGIDAYALINEK